MVGLGTLINVAAIVVGGLIGLALRQRLADHYKTALQMVCGVCVLFLGMAGTLSEMVRVVDGRFQTQGIMMLILTFAVGTILGEYWQLEAKIGLFGKWLRTKTGNSGDQKFIHAFLISSMTVCIGAMAVIGSIEDGIHGNLTILEAKSLLDCIIIAIMAAALGKGCLFSAIPVGIFQGSITLAAYFLAPMMTQQALANISLTGSVMIFCVGLNLVWGQKVSVANMLPTLLFAVLWSYWPAIY